MLLFSVFIVHVKRLLAMFLFLFFLLNGTVLKNLAPALLSNLSVPLKPEFFVFSFLSDYLSVVMEKESKEVCKVEK